MHATGNCIPIANIVVAYDKISSSEPMARNVTPHQCPHASEFSMGWIYHMLPRKMIFLNFNWMDSKHNFLLNPKWKWYLLKVLTFKTRYNNRHAHPNVSCIYKTRKNMPWYIHTNLFLNVNSNKKKKITMCLGICKFGSIWNLSL